MEMRVFRKDFSGRSPARLKKNNNTGDRKITSFANIIVSKGDALTAKDITLLATHCLMASKGDIMIMKTANEEAGN